MHRCYNSKPKCNKLKVKSLLQDIIININCKKSFKLKVEDTSPKLNICCGLVCDINIVKYYLRVNPNMIFLSKSNNYTDDVYIISNVVWNI